MGNWTIGDSIANSLSGRCLSRCGKLPERVTAGEPTGERQGRFAFSWRGDL